MNMGFQLIAWRLVLFSAVLFLPCTHLLAQTYSLKTQISTDSSISSILDSSHNTHVAWVVNTTAGQQVMYGKYSSSGVFSSVSASSVFYQIASVSIVADANDNPHISYFVKRVENAEYIVPRTGNNAVYYAGSTDAGISFVEEQISRNPLDPADNTDDFYNSNFEGQPQIGLTSRDGVWIYYTTLASLANSYDNWAVIASKSSSGWSLSKGFNITRLPGTFSEINGFEIMPKSPGSPYVALIDTFDYSPRFINHTFMPYQADLWDSNIISGYAGEFDNHHAQMDIDDQGIVHYFWFRDDGNSGDTAFYHTTINENTYGAIERIDVSKTVVGKYFPATIDAVTGKLYFSYTEGVPGGLPHTFLIEYDSNSKVSKKFELVGVGLPQGKRSLSVHNGFISYVGAAGNSLYISHLDASNLSNGGSITTPEAMNTALDTSKLEWATNGNTNWVVQNSKVQVGQEAMRSGLITHDQHSNLETTVTGPSTLSFYWSVSSETNFDLLKFYIDDVEMDFIGGEIPWEQKSFNLHSGTHNIKWSYKKDGANTAGTDAAWLDGVKLIAVNDSDGDGINDNVDTDNDNDGIPDKWEVSYGLNPRDASDARLDADNDGSSNIEEYIINTNPKDAQSVATSQSYLNAFSRVVDTNVANNNALQWNQCKTDWAFQKSRADTGSSALESTLLNGDQENSIEATVDGISEVSFSWSVSSEVDFDFLTFYIDDVEVASISGEVDWEKKIFALSDAKHTLRWVYSKDSDTSKGKDQGWLDNIKFVLGYQKQEAFIERLYQNILGRSADAGGMLHWKKIIQSSSATEVAMGFFNSQEFINRGLSNADYVNILYQTLFDRKADNGGFDTWTSQLNNGELRSMVNYGFYRSQEFKNLSDDFGISVFSENDEDVYQVSEFVKRFYTLVLDRQPDKGGFNNWTSQLNSGVQSGGDIATGFFMSAEFTNRQTDDNTFVDICYQAFFGRAADTGGKTNWLNELAKGRSRLDVVNGFIGSLEFSQLATRFGIRAR